MKLFREVKASERLPEEKGWYHVIQPHESEYVSSSWFNGKELKGFGIISWLEPIEITEEEIEGVLRKASSKSEDGWIVIWANDFEKAAKAILSKLKGDE